MLGVRKIWLPAELIWTPDIVITNNANQLFTDGIRTNAIVHSSGLVLWMYPLVVTTYCTLDVRYFPFDTQHCDIIFISWTYNGFEVDLDSYEADNVANYYTETNQEWTVKNITAKRNVKFYACCQEPFPDVKFTLTISRRSTFYVFNLVFPCFLLYSISLLGFFLPVDSSDKVNLEITILLAMVVFLMVIGETLPPTPDAIPLLGMFFGLTMILVSVALVMAVIVTNFYYRKDTSDRVPLWVRVGVLKCCPLPNGQPMPLWRILLHGGRIKATVSHSLSADRAGLNRYPLDKIFTPPTSRKLPRSGIEFGRTTVPTLERDLSLNRNRSNRDVRNGVYARSGELPFMELSSVGHMARWTPQVNGGDIHERTDDCCTFCESPLLGSHLSPRLSKFEIHRQQEWKLLAKKLDSVFFWLFLTLSLSVQVLLLIKIPINS